MNYFETERDARLLEQLAELFRCGGYVRPPAAKRLAATGTGHFRRGYEFRFLARSRDELLLIRNLLRQVGFNPKRPFKQGQRYCQPVYGRDELHRFLTLIGEDDM